MAFATDRMLLVLEPNLFRDVQFAGQAVLAVTDGVTAGTTLSSIAVDFVTAGVEAGQVALVNAVPVEIVEVLTAHTLTVSRLRPDVEGNPIPPLSGLGQTVEVFSFAAQCELSHNSLLRLFGEAVAAEEVVNVKEVARVEALGALYLIFLGATGLVGEEVDGLERKAALYRERYRAGREALVVQLDLDGDGVADGARVSNILRLARE